MYVPLGLNAIFIGACDCLIDGDRYVPDWLKKLYNNLFKKIIYLINIIVNYIIIIYIIFNII